MGVPLTCVGEEPKEIEKDGRKGQRKYEGWQPLAESSHPMCFFPFSCFLPKLKLFTCCGLFEHSAASVSSMIYAVFSSQSASVQGLVILIWFPEYFTGQIQKGGFKTKKMPSLISMAQLKGP